jgi:hypothetical protein
VELVKVGVNPANALVDPGDKIAVGKAAPIKGPFDFSRWKEPPHVALVNLRTDPAAALRFTRTYGVLSLHYKEEATSLSVGDVFRFRDYLQGAWQDDAVFLKMLNDPNPTKATLWTRRSGMEIVINDLWTLIRVMFSRDCWDGRARKCASPDCPAPFFLAVRKGQKFCSQRCAVLVNVRRFRESQGKGETRARRIAKDQRRIRKAIEGFILDHASAADWRRWEVTKADWRQWVATKAGVSLDDLSRALHWGEQGKPGGVKLNKLQAQYFRKVEKGEKP